MRYPNVLILAALVAAPAFAQTAPVKSFNLDQLALNPGGRHSLVLGTGDPLEQGGVRLSLAAQYQNDPLVYTLDGERLGAVVGSRFSSHLGVAWGVGKGIELGLQLPVVLSQSGDDLTGHGIDPVSSTAVGAPLLQAQLALLRQEDQAPVDLGVGAGLALPLGSGSGLARDPGPGFAFIPRVGAARSFGLFRVGGEVGAVLRDRDTLSRFSSDVQDEVGSLFTVGLTASTLNEGLRGEVTVRSLLPLTRTAAAVEVMAGARYPLPGNFEVFALAGPGFGQLPGNPAFRAFAGVAFSPFAAPACVEGKPYALADCPDLDRDQDRIANAKDACPEEGGLASLDGCPDGDDDGDGVQNLADGCPQVGASTLDGCPRDGDLDGLADAQDRCPDQPGAKEEGGCPPPPAVVDSDGDGLEDTADDCPEVPGDAKNKGCAAVALQADRIEIQESIRFATGEARVLEVSMAVLKEVASVLEAHPELTRLEIAGHTDDRGSRAFNLDLSQRRADAVRQALIGLGVEPGRLTAKGFGPDRPIASNADAAGREQNRRVEFTSLQ